MKHLTADSIEYDERISLYSEQTFLCYKSMLLKLEEVIKSNPELKDDDSAESVPCVAL